MIEFENGLHPVHDRTDPTEQAANLRWFQQQWDRLTIGGCLGTDACTYVKTETGFRRLTEEQNKAHLQAVIDKKGYAVIADDDGIVAVITNGDTK